MKQRFMTFSNRRVLELARVLTFWGIYSGCSRLYVQNISCASLLNAARILPVTGMSIKRLFPTGYVRIGEHTRIENIRRYYWKF